MYKQYSSSNSQFKSNMMHSSVGKMDMQESIQQKKQFDQTINSDDQSLESQDDIPQMRNQAPQNIERTNTNREVNSNTQIRFDEFQPPKQNQIIETENYILNTEDIQEDKQLNQVDIQILTNNSQPRTSILPYKKQNQKLVPFQPEKSVKSISIASYYTGSSKGRKGQQKQVFAFHYDRIGDQVSKLFEAKNPVSFLFVETLFPLLIVMILQIVLMILQHHIDGYCFIDNFNCENYSIRFWSFIRQELLFKLGIIFTKGHIIYQLSQGNRLLKQKHRRPLMEYSILIIFAIATDFVMIFWIGLNEDWLFLLYIYIIGIVVFFNTFRMKTWPSNLKKGFSFFSYDLAIIGLLCYVFWFLPYVRNSLQNHSKVAAPEYYMFIYPFLDLIMEIFIDLILSMTKYGELFIYQAQMIIIGTRVGTLVIGSFTRFDYWFCLFFLIIFRINNASIVLTVFVRRFIYYAMPESFRPLVSMEETNSTLKGKHGACYEHLIWIFYLYILCISGKTITYYSGKLIEIKNTQFDTDMWGNYERWKYQPIIVWLFLIVPEIAGYYINRSKCYDNIKMMGGNKLRFYENVSIRMIGFYLFNFALLSNLV